MQSSIRAKHNLHRQHLLRLNHLALLQDAVKNGVELFTQRCGRCHALPSPSDHTATEWKPIIDAMAPKAKLTAEETNWVLAYVNANAKK